MIEYKISRFKRPSGATVLSIKDAGWAPAYLAEVEKGGFDILHLGSRFEDDLIPLVRYAERIRGLEVSGLSKSLAGLEALTHLKRLELEYVPAKAPDINQLLELEEIYIAWRRGLRWDLSRLPKLKKLTLVSYTGATLSELGYMRALETLDLRQGTLQSLVGIESMPSLRNIQLSYLRRLERLSPLHLIAHRLQGFHLEKCSKAEAASFIVDCRALQYLFTDARDPGFKDTRWMKNCHNLVSATVLAELEEFCLSDVMVSPHLRALSFKVKLDQLPTDDEIRRAAAALGLSVLRGGVARGRKSGSLAVWFTPIVG